MVVPVPLWFQMSKYLAVVVVAKNASTIQELVMALVVSTFIKRYVMQIYTHLEQFMQFFEKKTGCLTIRILCDGED